MWKLWKIVKIIVVLDGLTKIKWWKKNYKCWKIWIKKQSTIVCVLTGNGLKDPDCAIKNNDAIFQKNVEPSLKNITKILGY